MGFKAGMKMVIFLTATNRIGSVRHLSARRCIPGSLTFRIGSIVKNQE